MVPVPSWYQQLHQRPSYSFIYSFPPVRSPLYILPRRGSPPKYSANNHQHYQAVNGELTFRWWVLSDYKNHFEFKEIEIYEDNHHIMFVFVSSPTEEAEYKGERSEESSED